MHSMLNEFYEFIAKKVNSFFQKAASDGTLLKGESFCLKLDNDDMVAKVSSALKHLAEENKIIGIYELVCRDNSVYKTYTLKVKNDEVIIAAQIDGMTNDFLCATLRNAANSMQKSLLMISSNPIDSAKSGSRDMAANGMPFYSEQLMVEIKEKVESSTELANLEKRVLQFELNRRDTDVFSDKSSIYEYRDLLSIMSSGKIDQSNYQSFRLFAVAGKTDYQNESDAKIDKIIKENNILYERIDRGLRFGNLEAEMSKTLDTNIINDIEREYKRNSEKWSETFTYASIVAAMEKKQAKMENPLNIENEDIVVYGDLPINALAVNDQVIIRNEGSQTAKKRTKNILIFNSDQYASIHLKVSCNITVLNNAIVADDAEYTKKGKSIIFKFIREEISFHKIQIEDKSNNITYIFKIAIMDMPAQFILPTVKHSFSIVYKPKKSNCRIKLVGVGNTNGLDKDEIRYVWAEVCCEYMKARWSDIECSTDEKLLIQDAIAKIFLKYYGENVYTNRNMIEDTQKYINWLECAVSQKLEGRSAAVLEVQKRGHGK